MQKLLVVGVIALFLGLACAPSINANVGKESELVEITTEIYGLDGGKHTVQLTQEEAEEVEQLIDDIERRLDEVETREEAVEIFNKAIVELDKYGLLGGLSVKQAQRLVIGGYQNQKLEHIFKDIYDRNLTNTNDSNSFCLISGSCDLTGIIDPFPLLIVIHIALIYYRYSIFANFISNILIFLSTVFGINKLCELIANFFNYIVDKFLEIRFRLLSDLALLVHLFPIKIGSIITFGLPNFDPYGEPRPATGEIVTIGLNGKKTWRGNFFGDIYPYIGVVGFSGLKIFHDLLNNSFLGFAYKVSLSEEYLFD